MFTTMIIAADGSDHARKAIAIGSDLAVKYDAQIIMLHVISDAKVPDELGRFARSENLSGTDTGRRVKQIEATPQGPIHLPGGAEERIDEGAVSQAIAEKILNEAQGIASERGVAVIDTVIEEGDPTERILEVAQREQADGIVMGSRGLSDLKGIVVGSVSHKVCDKAPCTCVIVT